MANLIGDSSDPTIAAVQGTQTGDGGTGVLGVGTAHGVIGQSTGGGFSGVFGQSETGPGVTGQSVSSVGVDAKSQGGPAALRAVNAGERAGSHWRLPREWLLGCLRREPNWARCNWRER